MHDAASVIALGQSRPELLPVVADVVAVACHWLARDRTLAAERDLVLRSTTSMSGSVQAEDECQGNVQTDDTRRDGH